MSGDDNQRDIEEEPTHPETSDHSNIRAFSVLLMIIGTILLFISLGECMINKIKIKYYPFFNSEYILVCHL